MTLPGKLVKATSGLKGFDCNQHVSIQAAKVFRDNGYRFCIRYVPRHQVNPGDLTASEASGILAMGLAIMIVQHVQLPGWSPTGAMGKEYGTFAALSATQVGVKFGTTVWCDLEGVKVGTDHRDVISFCNYWLDQVGHAGFTPGLYVGYDAGLTAAELYRNLRFAAYWSAYNLDHDKYPAVRGVMMRQGVEKVLSGIRFDPDTIQADSLGDLPLMHVDNEWTP